jgi:hypothetical protein
MRDEGDIGTDLAGMLQASQNLLIQRLALLRYDLDLGIDRAVRKAVFSFAAMLCAILACCGACAALALYLATWMPAYAAAGIVALLFGLAALGLGMAPRAPAALRQARTHLACQADSLRCDADAAPKSTGSPP